MKPNDIVQNLFKQTGYSFIEISDKTHHLEIKNQLAMLVCNCDWEQLELSCTGNRKIWEHRNTERVDLKSFGGEAAYLAYEKEFSTHIYLVIEGDRRPKWQFFELNLGQNDKLPNMRNFLGVDVYLAHHNFRWVLLKTHEENQMPLGDPWFLKRR